MPDCENIKPASIETSPPKTDDKRDLIDHTLDAIELRRQY